MKVLALVGSPREMGNTDLLVEQLLEGARTKGYLLRSFTFMITRFLCVVIVLAARRAIMSVVCMMRSSRFIR